MPIIELETRIQANIDVVFDLSRSIDLHLISSKQTHEKAIAGKTSGLIELGETVTWKAKHLGIYQTLTTQISAYDKPRYFVDEQIQGIFKSFKHEHLFTVENGETIMMDRFHYVSPFGILGKLVDWLFLETYMTQFLKTRNMSIKEIAEDSIVSAKLLNPDS
tara:strand:+ start:762 stop:1247 length:486 start_codon:yes stop_codon:yes gene_type:complete